MKKIVLAGASSIYGIETIRKTIFEFGIDIIFVETEKMMQYVDEKDCFIQKMNYLELLSEYEYIPLNEYWVSYGYEHGIMKVSDRAYLCGRSKRFFSELLMNHGIDACKCLSGTDIVNYVTNENRSVLIKPDSYYSGHGVKVVDKDNIDKIDFYWNQAKKISSEAKSVLAVNAGKAEIWEYIHGDEYSVDVFVYEGTYHILRLCMKKIVFIEDAPCTVAYITVPISMNIENVIHRWMDALFDDTDISFAQFDFIISQEQERIVPIDFACRVGGGMRKMFKMYKNNIYLEALKSMIRTENGSQQNEEGIYQYNILPQRTGKIVNDNYGAFEGTMMKIKKCGDLVKSVDPSANNRLGVVIGRHYKEQCFQKEKKNLVLGEGHITDIES